MITDRAASEQMKGLSAVSDTPETDAVLHDLIKGGCDIAHPTNVVLRHARALERSVVEQQLLLQLAAAKLRQMGNEFARPNFTDRYNDGPTMLNIAHKIDALLAKLAPLVRPQSQDIAQDK